jgi:outer membrane protein assembly factor BamC
MSLCQTFFTRKSVAVAIGLSIASLLSGCSTLSAITGKNSDYRSGGVKLAPLEIPPDLTSPTSDDRFLIPDGGSKGTTFSAYSRERAAGQGTTPAATGSALLPKLDNARIARAGDQRYLVVSLPADKVWPVVKEFWVETGFILKREVPEAGVMETDWAENRSKIPQDPIRNTLGRFIDSAYSTPERDKFRTRLETGTVAGTTEVYISHRGVEDVFTGPEKERTTWQPRATDRDLEVEMLSRLMVKFGITPEAAKTIVAAAPASATASTASTAGKAIYDQTGAGILRLSEPFDAAWRRVGLALDQVGFSVEDRDRTKGQFFVRYFDPDADKSAGKSFLDTLQFWKTPSADNKPQYRVQVTEIAGGSTNVVVQNAKGESENSATGKRILSLLFAQLK